MNFLSFALREGAVFSLNSALALSVSPGRRTTQGMKFGRLLKTVGDKSVGSYFLFVLFCCSGSQRAPRHTPGCLALCPFRPEDKILSSWRHTRVRHLFIGPALGRETAARPCVMGFSCERDSPSEPRPGLGESPLDEGVSHAEVGPKGSPSPHARGWAPETSLHVPASASSRWWWEHARRWATSSWSSITIGRRAAVREVVFCCSALVTQPA